MGLIKSKISLSCPASPFHFALPLVFLLSALWHSEILIVVSFPIFLFFIGRFSQAFLLHFLPNSTINISAAHALEKKAAMHWCWYWHNWFFLIIGTTAYWMSPLICDPFRAGAHQTMWRLNVFIRSWTHCCHPQSRHIALDKLVLWF